MSDYPIPSYAAYIWAAGDRIWLGFPAMSDGTPPHSVPYPATERGLTLAVEALKARRVGDRTIGNHGAPTRHSIEVAASNDKKYKELLKALAMNDEREKEEKAKAERFLEELGL